MGSLARRELGPRSDLDLVLLHETGRSDSEAVHRLADRLWYPLWDSGTRIDHAVRTPAECVRVATDDIGAAIGLLDLRPLAGDRDLVHRVRADLAERWRRGIRRRLPELIDEVEERALGHGEAAHLAEPDLKESRGGFRDMIMVRALVASWLVDRPHGAVDAHHDHLLDVRDALHLSSGRNLDRLVAAEAAEVAARLRPPPPGATPDVDGLRRSVSLSARHLTQALDLTLRAARRALPRRSPARVGSRRPDIRRLDHGVIVSAAEVGLDRGATPDRLTGLRAAAAAARRSLPLSPVTAARLGTAAGQGSTAEPWTSAEREALLDLLATGDQLPPVWETLDLAGCIVGWLPVWESVRTRPQHNPVHRHTVDRHLIQAVAEAGSFLSRVARPDLLLMAALLHDIGKNGTEDVPHAMVGAPIARETMITIGFPGADAEVVGRLVAHHLTLVEHATQRDHTDPATVAAVTDAVGRDPDTCDLLRWLSEADARAAGPAAWSGWRSRLVHGLADRVQSSLTRTPVSRPVQPGVELGLARSVSLDGRIRVRYEAEPGGTLITIAAADRPGLFADQAELLAAHRVGIRSATIACVERIAVNRWRVEHTGPAALPDPDLLVQQLTSLLDGDRRPLRTLRRREASSRPGPSRVLVIEDASERCTVVEVRAADRTALLASMGRALTDLGVDIRSAHVSTIAGQAIDTFYLTWRDRPLSTERTDAVRSALEAVGGGTTAGQ